MTIDEFSLIKKYFAEAALQRADVVLGIGDDAAIVQVPAQQQLIITTDTLVNGIHFPENTSPFDIGFKALAVNLSDLAAMGATPAWVTLALTLPKANEHWLAEFSRGFFTLASRYNVQLIGGDMTHGPLSITIQAQGFVPANLALRRDQAKVDDLIYVTHTLGDAALGLCFLNKKITVAAPFQQHILARLNRPEPQIKIGESLRNIAHAAIDISDGLAADLNHILEKSQVGAILYVDQLPLSHALRESVSSQQAIAFALTGGDDYELCFTVPSSMQHKVPEHCVCIGKITAQLGFDLQFSDGEKYQGDIRGYQHF